MIKKLSGGDLRIYNIMLLSIKIFPEGKMHDKWFIFDGKFYIGYTLNK